MEKPIGLCYAARSWYGPLDADMFKHIKNDHAPDIKGYFIVSNDKEERYVRGLVNDETAVYINVTKYFTEHWDEFTYDKFLEIEEKYDLKPLWKYVYMDRFLIMADKEYCAQITAGYFSFYEFLFGTYDIDYFYDEAISTMQTFAGYAVGPHYGVQYVSQMIARGATFDDTMHYYITEPYQINFDIDDSHPLEYYSEEERAAAEKYLKDFEDKDIKPVCSKEALDYPHIRWNLLLCIPRFFYLLFNKPNNDKHFYMYYHHHMEALYPFGNLVRYWRSKKYAVAPDYSKKFVFFPLHFQPESSTLYCSPKYEKQLVAIDAIAKSLPADTFLYIKEHYQMLGKRPLSFYKELQQYPNVVLIDPWENARIIIQHCEAVFTLTGTAGFEAFLLGKPVLLAGRTAFETAPGIELMDDYFDKYVPFMEKWQKPTRDEQIRWLCAYMRTLYPGTVENHSDHVYSDENCRLLADSLYDYMVQNYGKFDKE